MKELPIKFPVNLAYDEGDAWYYLDADGRKIGYITVQDALNRLHAVAVAAKEWRATVKDDGETFGPLAALDTALAAWEKKA